jgi:hypothetical protein
MQSQGEIKRLLQQKIFGHNDVLTFNPYSQMVFRKLSKCHTIGLGVHTYQCDKASCQYVHHQYHCCGDRHCPNCGGAKRDQWIDDRMCELLPVKYFHVVFTLPFEFNSLVMGNRTMLLNQLFKSAHYTLLKLGQDDKWLGAKLGIVSILHTHGQDLSFHPHVHCIVSGGGVDTEGKWKCLRRKDNFLFPRRIMEKMYKAHFMENIERMLGDGDIQFTDAQDVITLLHTVRYKKWNVYAKVPFAGPAQIIEYLGRYTHKVAITSHRITEIDDQTITFKYKDYKDGNKQKSMTLTHAEFLRRYEQHILPRKFVKIRHCGYLSPRDKTLLIKDIYDQLQLLPPTPKATLPIRLRLLIKTGIDITVCPVCKEGKMIYRQTLVMHNGSLIQTNFTRNRGSPTMHISR